MRHIFRCLGADRPPLWHSPAWKLQAVRRPLCTSTVISDARTASAFLNGHWPVPGWLQLALCMQEHGHRTAPLQTARFLKAVPWQRSGIVNFLKRLEFWRNHVSKFNDATENEQSYVFARKWSLIVNSHLRVAVVHPFLAVVGLKEVPRAPVREHVTPFKTAGHLPAARGGGGYSCSPPDALREHASNWSNITEEKSFWRWKVAERCQLRRRTATVRLLCDAFFNGPLSTFRTF
jgi:hypothetical protein